MQQLIFGLRDGSLFALVALGLVIIHNTTGVLNFAYGHMGMFAAYITFSCYAFFGFPLVLAILTGLVFAVIIGILTEKFLLRPIRHLSHSAMLIITLGMLMTLEGFALLIWKQDTRQLPNLITGRPLIINIQDTMLVITRQDLLIFVLTAVIVFGTFFYLKYTKLGLAVRASSQSEEAAKLMGIPVGGVYGFAWGFGTALSALAAILAAPKTYVHPNMMVNLQIQGLTAAVLGGFDSLPGAIVGGLLLGVIEQFVGEYISAELKMAFALIIIICLLMIKPSGILGKSSKGRV
ncbi:MAG TPA: branched-chain amino acid ABC transporter permease [Thermotogota bacterium]|nr:branched-chain amino acid ABC transporter permease [Thermotogota bacterium]HPJ89020.1 branched-chain amino acid ABC transporter permease [Thermotogota bacterium]HPR95531.1 branched-chain amino acid ABC transporter permease [Thermotogota bacterium]